eukprot:3232968-Prymnesium_polylepis.2
MSGPHYGRVGVRAARSPGTSSDRWLRSSAEAPLHHLHQLGVGAPRRVLQVDRRVVRRGFERQARAVRRRAARQEETERWARVAALKLCDERVDLRAGDRIGHAEGVRSNGSSYDDRAVREAVHRPRAVELPLDLVGHLTKVGAVLRAERRRVERILDTGRARRQRLVLAGAVARA